MKGHIDNPRIQDDITLFKKFFEDWIHKIHIYGVSRVTILEWAAIGALMLGIMVFCARAMKRGLRTLDDDRNLYMDRIRAGEKKLSDDQKKISSEEHLRVVHAALEDLFRLDGDPEGFGVELHDKSVEVITPNGSWIIELIMNERKLRSTSKILHGTGRWFLRGFGHYEHHPDPASLLRSLNSHLHSTSAIEDEPEHLARRLAGTREAARLHRAS